MTHRPGGGTSRPATVRVVATFMVMTAFLSRWLGELGRQDQQAVVAVPQIVAEVTQDGGEIATVPSPEGDAGVGGDPAGVVESVEEPGQSMAVLLHRLQELGQT